MELGNMQITSKLPFYVLLPRPWRVSEPMKCPTLEVQGLLSDLAEPTVTMAMDSSLVFLIHRFTHPVQLQANPFEVQ